MNKTLYVIVCDSDLRRRAAVSHFLADLGIHAEPFDDPGEAKGYWSRSDLVLVHDDSHAIGKTIDQLFHADHFLPLIAYAESPSTHRVARAVQAGAFDYLAWPTDSEEIWETIRHAEANGATYCSLKRRETRARRQLERLSKREREVLTGVAEGLSNRSIGERLAISPRTVEIHRANMLMKMGANHTSDAIRIAVEASLVD
ncbi:MAG TPA: LuxR C-terminal-related transcriptional regulator [Novosphingobium sp.]